MPFNFGKTAVSVALAALVSLATLAADVPCFADEPSTQETSAPFDASLFEIPSGKSAAFYQERLVRLDSPELSKKISSLQGPEHGVLYFRARKARLAVYARLSECEDASSETRFSAFFVCVSCSNLAERREIFAAEKAKKSVDFDRLRLAELFVLEGRFVDEAKYFAEKKAIVAEILAAARTKFNAPTRRDVVYRFFNLADAVDKAIHDPRDFGSNFRRDVADALQKSSDPEVRAVARALRAQAQARSNELSGGKPSVSSPASNLIIVRDDKAVLQVQEGE